MGWASDTEYGGDRLYDEQLTAAGEFAQRHNLGVWDECGGFEIPVAREAQNDEPAPISNECDPNYTPCVPSVLSDLDCGDIEMEVEVVGTDVHRFDPDGNGVGCTSYG
jgi:hypothetical protein